MPAPIDMNTVTESSSSLESSLQNLYLSSRSSDDGGMVEPPCAGNKSSAPTSDLTDDDRFPSVVQLELNSDNPLPYFWEQCLDLKTGEIYYINWRTGLRYDEDPRTNPHILVDDYYVYPEDEDEDDDDNDDDSYDSSYVDSEGSSSSEESSESLSSFGCLQHNNNNMEEREVLVVAGCKNCYMYFMVPKQMNECSKCNGRLMHFYRSKEDEKA